MPDSGIYPDKYIQWFEKHGVGKPSFASHGITDEDVRSKMTRIMPKSWVQEGNWIYGETEMGELRLNVGVDKKLQGTNEEGLPILVNVTM